MKILEVILVASQLALIVCLPQDIRFVQPSRLQLGHGPAEGVSLGFANDDGQRKSVPFDFRRVFPETFFISDRNQNQFASSSPNVVTVTFEENKPYPPVHFIQQTGVGQGNPSDYVRVVPSKPQGERPSQQLVGPQQAGIVFESAFQPRPDRVGSFERENEVVDQQRRYVIIPSRQTAQDREQEHRLPNPQSAIFWRPDVQTEPSQHRNEGFLYHDTIAPRPASPIQETSSGQLTSNRGSAVGSQRPLRMQNHGQTADSTWQYPISEPLPIAIVERKPAQAGSADVTRSDATLVTLLTAPSNDPKSSNTLMITKRPCEICCVGNEVAPCKSCCAYTPLLNPKTLKTVVG